MPVKRNYPTYQPPNYRGMPGTTPPFVPEPIPQNGQVPQQPPAIPPYLQDTPQVTQPTDQRTLMQKLRDPRFAGLLLSMGAAMGQPRQFGQTGWGQAAQAMAQGYNFLGMSQAAQEAAKRQHWEDQIRMQELAMKQQMQGVDIEDKKASTENKKNADIFKRDANVREGRKVDILATDTESKIQDRDANTQLRAQEIKNKLTQAEQQHREAMAREERMYQQNASREERLAAAAKTDAAFKAMEAARRIAQDAATASYRKESLGVAKQRADAATTAANAAAGRSTAGSDKSNPEFIRLMGIVKQDPENFGISEDELVAKAQRLYQALPNKQNTPAAPKAPTLKGPAKLALRPDRKTVYVEGQGEIVFPDEARARKYIELKSKEQK